MSIENVKAGDKMPDAENKVGKYTPIYYAGSSGDFNPIHIDPDFGKMVGLGGNILQGLCTMAYVMKSCTDWAGDPGALKRLKVRFAKPVYPLDTVVVHGEVKATGDDGSVVCDLSATTKNGSVQVITNAEAEFRKV